MAEEPLSQARLDGLWRELQQAVSDSAWMEAEGLLLRLIQLAPSPPIEVWDTLGYALLMQGDYQGCLKMLTPWQQHPCRSFWVNHKIGDALRGLNDLEAAAAAYRRSLADGSNSPLTWRNLLQCLDGLSPLRAVAELQPGTNVPPEAWEGARAAALLTPDTTLAEQLWEWGEADAACRRRLLNAAFYALDLAQVQRLLGVIEQQQVMSAWEQQLLERLRQLTVIPPATSGPSVGARSRRDAHR